MTRDLWLSRRMFVQFAEAVDEWFDVFEELSKKGIDTQYGYLRVGAQASIDHTGREVFPIKHDLRLEYGKVHGWRGGGGYRGRDHKGDHQTEYQEWFTPRVDELFIAVNPLLFLPSRAGFLSRGRARRRWPVLVIAVTFTLLAARFVAYLIRLLPDRWASVKA